MSRWSGETKAMQGTVPPVYRLAINSTGLRQILQETVRSFDISL